jgi:hypothetical protein
MLFTAFLIATTAPSEAGNSKLAPARVSDVVAAAMNCFHAVAMKDVEVSRLTEAGWSEVLDSAGKPETPGGHIFRRPGLSAEIAVAGPVCSLVAPVTTFDDVQAALLGIDDAVHPDRIEEVKQGILLHKGTRRILFFVGSPTVKSPAAVRIDVMNSESR